ncbi:MAG: ScpA family protein [Pseudomonadota bacterium]
MSEINDTATAPEDVDPFDAEAPGVAEEFDIDALIINLDGYEGPLDVLLELARAQKVDLRKISMVALVDQYLIFVEAAKQRNLELAADYLVMAAWLAFLKSRLLLPVGEEVGDEPTADEMAARLAFQLQRLEAMRKAVEDLENLPRLGVNVFPRGAPEGVRVTRTPEWHADLYEMLQAYARQRIAAVDRDYHIDPPRVYTIEMARLRLERILGSIPDWSELRALTPVQDVDAPAQSVIASAFNAALEFAKDGRIDLRQMGAFEPIYIRTRKSERNSNEPHPAERNGE